MCVCPLCCWPALPAISACCACLHLTSIKCLSLPLSASCWILLTALLCCCSLIAHAVPVLMLVPLLCIYYCCCCVPCAMPLPIACSCNYTFFCLTLCLLSLGWFFYWLCCCLCMCDLTLDLMLLFLHLLVALSWCLLTVLLLFVLSLAPAALSADHGLFALLCADAAVPCCTCDACDVPDYACCSLLLFPYGVAPLYSEMLCSPNLAALLNCLFAHADCLHFFLLCAPVIYTACSFYCSNLCCDLLTDSCWLNYMPRYTALWCLI